MVMTASRKLKIYRSCSKYRTILEIIKLFEWKMVMSQCLKNVWEMFNSYNIISGSNISCYKCEQCLKETENKYKEIDFN